MSRRLAVLAAVLLAAGGLAVVLLRRADRLERLSPLAGFPAGQLFRVEIARQGEPGMAVEKKAGLWRLTAPIDELADPASCEKLVASLSGLSVGPEVSSDPGRYADYDLSEASATHVRVYSRERAVAALDGYFGKPALGPETLYFRRAREKPVFLAEGVGLSLLSRPADYYRKKITP